MKGLHQSSIKREGIVKSNSLQKRLVIPIATFFLAIIALLAPASWTCADEDMWVTCYKGSSRIGTVTVFDWRAAAVTCNAVLYDCRGVCMGCFRDSDYIDDVCVDVHGREFLR